MRISDWSSDVCSSDLGGGYRGNHKDGDGMLTVTAPANLTNANGDTIPFSQISWTSSGNGDTGAQPFPAGTFRGGVQRPEERRGGKAGVRTCNSWWSPSP